MCVAQSTHLSPDVKLNAATLFTHLTAIRDGRYGGVELMNLFD